MNRCEIKESKECDSQTRHLEDVGWVCEPCYYWLTHAGDHLAHTGRQVA